MVNLIMLILPLVSIPYLIITSIWQRNSTKTGKVSTTQALQQVVKYILEDPDTRNCTNLWYCSEIPCLTAFKAKL